MDKIDKYTEGALAKTKKSNEVIKAMNAFISMKFDLNEDGTPPEVKFSDNNVVLSISKRDVSFNIYRRTAEFPFYKIIKNLKEKNKNEKYLIKDSGSKIINNSENLESLIKKVIWRKFKLVN